VVGQTLARELSDLLWAGLARRPGP
jgi:hypothetical protein